MSVRHEVLVDGEVKRVVPSEERANEVKTELEGSGEVTIRPAS